MPALTTTRRLLRNGSAVAVDGSGVVIAGKTRRKRRLIQVAPILEVSRYSLPG